MKVELTERGFELVKFKDANGKDCSLQQSSAIGEKDEDMLNPGTSFIWLGREPCRMHLNRQQTFLLAMKLMNWLDHGKF